MEIAEVVMNPVRQRIFQYFFASRNRYGKELKKRCPTFRTQVYTGMSKSLADHSILTVVGENRISRLQLKVFIG